MNGLWIRMSWYLCIEFTLIEAHSVKVIYKFVGWLNIHQTYPYTNPRPMLSPCLGCRYPTHCPSPTPSLLFEQFLACNMAKVKYENCQQCWKFMTLLTHTHTPMSGCTCVCSKYATNFKLICRQEKEKSEMGKTLQPFHMFHFATNYRNRRLFQVYAKFPTWFFERTYNSYITVKWHFYCLAKKYREERRRRIWMGRGGLYRNLMNLFRH